MPLSVTTWNINSVRLRIDLVAKFIKAARPDVICLQETKCPDDAFPLKRFKRLGYEHAALNGQKGYHGVAVLSQHPFEHVEIENFCGKTDCRHIKVVLGERAGLKDQVTLHNFYVPAGGDEPDPEVNPKFAHKPAAGEERARDPRRRSQRRAARARRLEPQADDQGGLAHAGRMREAQRGA
jgi:exodeoxyribonuclease-3